MEKISKITVAVILFVSLILMVTVSLQESGTMDELAHIPAGYGYVRYLDYRLNPEHPPLVKMLAGFPLLFLQPNFPTESSAWQTYINGQWEMGGQFLYESENNADQIIQLSRIGPMILTLILILFVYIWSKELIGPYWALIPTLITALSPTFLAHGHYVTTDIGAALGTLIATYYFVKYLNSRSKKHLVWAGIAFGIAQLMKFSAVLLIPYFLLLALILYKTEAYRDWKQTKKIKIKQYLRRGLSYLGSVAMIFIIGYLLLYPFYFLTTINYPPTKQASDTEFILGSFAEGPTKPGETCKPMRCLAELDIWAADKPLLRPYAEYLLGVLMVMQRSAGGNTAYFMGEVSSTGSHMYFPILYPLKEPLPVLIMVLTALILGFYGVLRSIVKRKTNFANYVGTHTGEFAMLLFVLIYVAWSIQSPLNIGVRHLMPIMPFIYILSISRLKKWIQGNLYKKSIKIGFISVLLIWFLGSTALAYPFYLSYFNELVGTKNGWRYATDSNYDWGQDLKRLKTFVEKEKIDKIAINYFGAGNPKYYLGDRYESWWSSRGNPTEIGIEWVALSINNLQGAIAPAAQGFTRNQEDEYRWLENPYKPYAVVGTSIFVYKLR
jgi:hypothetical protein